MWNLEHCNFGDTQEVEIPIITPEATLFDCSQDLLRKRASG